MVEKAKSGNFPDRFREILSDPINLLIPRHPEAGMIRDGLVTLHNGNLVPVRGKGAYYAGFSEILGLNRGVHEPLEEYVFSLVLNRMPNAPRMLELGAYWGHYSMWMQQARPASTVHLVEPEAVNLDAGKSNFQRNGYIGTFEQAFVSEQAFRVDEYMDRSGWDQLHMLHCDIQGYELEMLAGAQKTLTAQIIDYICISTHSQDLHLQTIAALSSHGYRVEVAADYATETTCYDGFLLAVRADLPPIWTAAQPMSRVAINTASPQQLLDAVSAIQSSNNHPIDAL